MNNGRGLSFYLSSNLDEDEINTPNLRPHLSRKLAADIGTAGNSPASLSLCATVSAAAGRHQHAPAQVSVQEADLLAVAAFTVPDHAFNATAVFVFKVWAASAGLGTSKNAFHQTF